MNNKITSRQYIVFIIMFGLGSFIVSHGNRLAKQDTWGVVLLGFLIALPQILMIAYINKKTPDKNIFAVFKEYFGKIIGTIFSIYFLIFIIILTFFFARIFAEYIRITALTRTPIFLILTLIVVCCAYASSKNIQSIARLIGLLFLIFMASFLFLSVFSFSLIENFDNMLPIFHLSKINTLQYSYISYMNPYFEVFVLLFFGKYLSKGKSHYKTILIGTSLVAIILSFNSFRNILTLGLPAYYSLHFPSYISNTILNSGSMVERFELVYSFIFTVCLFAKLILFLNVTTTGVKDIIPKSKNSINLIALSIIVILLATFFVNDVSQLLKVLYSPLRSYMNIGILFIILLTFFFTVYKDKKRNSEEFL